MAYQITGLDPAQFSHLYDTDEAVLAAHGARRVTADARPGYPCRVTLEDATVGETLLLLPNRSGAEEGPFARTYAIFVHEGAAEAASFADEVPPVFATRPLSLRGFAADGFVCDAALVEPGRADAGIRRMLKNEAVAFIDVHNALPGCFAARVRRSGDEG